MAEQRVRSETRNKNKNVSISLHFVDFALCGVRARSLESRIREIHLFVRRCRRHCRFQTIKCVCIAAHTHIETEMSEKRSQTQHTSKIKSFSLRILSYICGSRIHHTWFCRAFAKQSREFYFISRTERNENRNGSQLFSLKVFNEF